MLLELFWKIEALSIYLSPMEITRHTLKTKGVCIYTNIWESYLNSNALVNVNSQGAPTGNSGDSDRVYLTHAVESNSIILTHSGDI